VLQEEDRPVFARRTYYTRPVWIVGMILIVLGAIGDFEALGCGIRCDHARYRDAWLTIVL
jgi:hypothetical protein